MAYIKKISFASVGKQEGCTCDKCGQYIRNIWTVDYQDGVSKGKLNDYGMKLMKKALKSIQHYQELLEAEKALTEETDERYQMTQEHHSWGSDGYWMGHPWEEYHKWMIEEWYPGNQ